MKDEILIIGPKITSFLDRYLKSGDISLIPNITGEEFRIYSLIKELEPIARITLAIQKESNSSLSFTEAPIVLYKEKLWVDDFEKLIKDFKLVIFSKENFLGLPTLLYSKKNFIIDLWNIPSILKHSISKKSQFYKNFLISPLLKEATKRSKAVLIVADNQKYLFRDTQTVKFSFISQNYNNKRGENIFIINEYREYYKFLAETFKIASMGEIPSLVISFDKDPLFFNWRLSQFVNHGIPILNDRRNVTIKELLGTKLAFGCDSTNLFATKKTIEKILNKQNLNGKKLERNKTFVKFIKDLL